jgi:hypothetical protein
VSDHWSVKAPNLDIPSASAEMEIWLMERGVEYEKAVYRDGGSIGFVTTDGRIMLKYNADPMEREIQVDTNEFDVAAALGQAVYTRLKSFINHKPKQAKGLKRLLED